MKNRIKNILITDDDGYNALGARALVKYLKGDYNLTISATKDQQSGVGGKLTLKEKIKWGREAIDGVDAFWVDGTPCDAVLFAKAYFKKKFDLIISGINLGANLSAGVFASGTFAAGFFAMTLQMVPKCLVMSWNCPHQYWVGKHSANDDLQSFFEHPGKQAKKVFDLAIKNNFWDSNMLNINFPEKPSDKIIFTKSFQDTTKTYSCDPQIDKKNRFYSYAPKIAPFKKIIGDYNYDVAAVLRKGWISITPCRAELTDEKIYRNLKNKIIQL